MDGGGGGPVPDYDDDNYSEEKRYQDIDYDDYDNDGEDEGNHGRHIDRQSDNIKNNDNLNNDNNSDKMETNRNIELDEIDEINQDVTMRYNCTKNVNIAKCNKASEEIIGDHSSDQVEINDFASENFSQTKSKMKEKALLTRAQKHKKMTEALCDVLGDFGLVSFLPMNIQDAEVHARHSTSQCSF